MYTLSPTVHAIDHELRVVGTHFGTRTFALAGPDGLTLIAPGDLSEADQRALEAVGPIVRILAPNALHHLWLSPAMARWPEAEVVISPALAQKRADLAHLPVFTPGWSRPGLQARPIAGMPKVGEWALFHEPSQSLILLDTCFHFREVDHAWTRCFLRLNGALDHFGPSRLAKTMIADKAALRRSLDEVCAWPFTQVLLAHGQPRMAGGPEALREAFSFLG